MILLLSRARKPGRRRRHTVQGASRHGQYRSLWRTSPVELRPLSAEKQSSDKKTQMTESSPKQKCFNFPSRAYSISVSQVELFSTNAVPRRKRSSVYTAAKVLMPMIGSLNVATVRPKKDCLLSLIAWWPNIQKDLMLQHALSTHLSGFCLSFLKLLGLTPLHFLKARENAVASEYPSR